MESNKEPKDKSYEQLKPNKKQFGKMDYILLILSIVSYFLTLFGGIISITIQEQLIFATTSILFLLVVFFSIYINSLSDKEY